jgi:hypothetical protein
VRVKAKRDIKKNRKPNDGENYDGPIGSTGMMKKRRHTIAKQHVGSSR